MTILLAGRLPFWHPAPPVPEKHEHSTTGESIATLNHAVEELSQEVRVLRDVLDEIREDFSWALRNGHAVSIEESVAGNPGVSRTEPSCDVVEPDDPVEPPKELPKEEEEPEDLSADVATADEIEPHDDPIEANPQPLQDRILECLSARVSPVNLRDIRTEMGFTEINSADPIANPVNRALVELRNTGNVSVIETDFGEPSFSLQCSQFLRPDRQTCFDGISFYQWPEPEEDRDTLTVDRVGNNADGGEHQFTVKRGDRVKVFFSREKQELGRVVGISQAKREARVSFREGSQGIWFAIGSIYPALEPASDEDLTPLSAVVEKVNKANTPQEKPGSEADRVASSSPDSADVPSRDSHGRGVESLTQHQWPYKIDDFQLFLQRLDSGQITAV